ncbi:VOC family protein [Acidovorax sp. FJL06]|uniref:VOC family protein n=1 Tax=Acidovorax sp. FJL06 TaxID=2153365 RepID=UPI000F56190A|nr:VOC family protein [Acidovorax sp. FJL06]RQO82718.1 VOC family protein [Acidovorax sp. FJL06]
MHANVSFLEIGADNAQVSQQFFSQFFQWTFEPTEKEGEGWFLNGGMKVGLHGADPVQSITPFFEVADAVEAAQRVRALGGTVQPPGPEEPGFGVFLMCTDPGGVRFGLHQPARR